MHKFWKFGLIAFVATVIGCDKPPVEQIATAQAAVESAQAAEAPEYAQQAFNTAKDSLNAALSAKEAEDKAWFKNYDAVRKSLANVEVLAKDAVAKSEANKAALRSEIQSVLSAVEPVLMEARTELAKAPRGKGADADLDQLNIDLSMVESAITEARGSLDAGKLNASLESAKTAQSRLEVVQNNVKAAQEKMAQWKQRRGRR